MDTGGKGDVGGNIDGSGAGAGHAVQEIKVFNDITCLLHPFFRIDSGA